jgi:signal transduction histidine kinase
MGDEPASFIRRHGDAILAGVLTALVLLEIGLTDRPMPVKLASGAFAVCVGLAASQRVRFPLLFLGLIFATSAAVAVVGRTSGYHGPDGVGMFGFLLLAVYSAAARTSGRGLRLAAAMTLGIFGADLAAELPSGIHPDAVVFFALMLGAPWIAGRAVRQRRMSDRQLEHERARIAAAVDEERARIARELHDVVAHSLSVMVLQARGGRRVLESAPADARDAFGSIETTGQQALAEMRRLLGLLRRNDEDLALAPQPSLRELDQLIGKVEAAGLPVQMTVEGERRDLPPGIELSAFRIVQEALTNALRHAGPTRARVILRYRPDALEVEVVDDGEGTGEAAGSGYGLIGMRERVAVYGGELDAGRRPEGGYALRVRLPLGPASA